MAIDFPIAPPQRSISSFSLRTTQQATHQHPQPSTCNGCPHRAAHHPFPHPDSSPSNTKLTSPATPTSAPHIPYLINLHRQTNTNPQRAIQRPTDSRIARKLSNASENGSMFFFSAELCHRQSLLLRPATRNGTLMSKTSRERVWMRPGCGFRFQVLRMTAAEGEGAIPVS